MPSIDRNAATPFYQQVYEQIARGIESGLYPAGRKLPSIRECARELGVSTTTVEQAYQRLTEEGYVQARRGSGYTICETGAKAASPFAHLSDSLTHGQSQLTAAETAAAAATPWAYDFAYDAVDPDTFPFALWARICREVFFDEGAAAACLYNDRQGLHALRDQIAQYLNREFSVGCVAEQVLVMPTTRDLVAEVISLFDPTRTVVAMEEPGYDEVGKRLVERGFQLRPLAVHPYPSTSRLLEMLDGVGLVFTTPACQFPSNHAMPADVRAALVEWAQRTDAYLIDDEYGWEFQSGTARTPAFAALDGAGRVITLGTFSNSFTPAVCLSYAVLPPDLMMRWQETRRDAHPAVPWQTQAAMARFMRESHWRSHVRKVRTSAQRKRQLLVNELNEQLGDAFDIIEGPSSLFVLAQARDGRGEQELIDAAARAGVRVYSTSRYWRDGCPNDWRRVLVGYAGIPIVSIPQGVNKLAQAWR